MMRIERFCKQKSVEQDCFAWREDFLFRHIPTSIFELLSMASICEEQLIEFIYQIRRFYLFAEQKSIQGEIPRMS